MIANLKKYWFFVGIAVVVTVAFALPAVGAFVKTYRILTVVIFLGFLTTGLTLETAAIGEQIKNGKVLAAALASSLFFFPAMAYGLAHMVFDAPPDWAIGALIIGAAPVTIASGTVMTAIALGNVPLSLFICVLSNLASILTIPFVLNLFLQFGDAPIVLPVVPMLTGLTVSYIVWSGHFAALYPMALIPAIAYHITQSIMDTLVAHRFRDSAERDRACSAATAAPANSS